MNALLLSTGLYTSWSAWGLCTESCQSNPAVSPYQTRVRTCIGGTLNGTCTGASSENQDCNLGIPCSGNPLPFLVYFGLIFEIFSSVTKFCLVINIP